MNISYEKPICNAIILCNEVIEDKRTNKKSLIGLFNSVLSPELPIVQNCLFVMVSLTNIQRKTPLKLVFRDPELQEYLRIDGEVEYDDPLATMDLVFEIHNVCFRKLGIHHIDISCFDEVPIANRRFNVIRTERQE